MEAAHARKPQRLSALDLWQVDSRIVADRDSEHAALATQIDSDFTPERVREIQKLFIEFGRRELLARDGFLIEGFELFDEVAFDIREVAVDFVVHIDLPS